MEKQHMRATHAKPTQPMENQPTENTTIASTQPRMGLNYNNHGCNPWVQPMEKQPMKIKPEKINHPPHQIILAPCWLLPVRG